SASLPASVRNAAKNGFFNEKMKLAVSSDENPCATRDREIPSRNSRMGLNSAPEMSPARACSEAAVSSLRNSADCCSSSAADMRPLLLACVAARSLDQLAWISLPLFINTFFIVASAIGLPLKLSKRSGDGNNRRAGGL